MWTSYLQRNFWHQCVYLLVELFLHTKYHMSERGHGSSCRWIYNLSYDICVENGMGLQNRIVIQRTWISTLGMHLLLWELIMTVEHMLPNAELIHLGYKKHDVKMESLLACLSLSPIFCKSSNCRSIQVARVNITICKTRGKYMLGKPQVKGKKCAWFFHISTNLLKETIETTRVGN